MRKKGVSPLIASVLLIAFTIMLFVLISTWVRKSAIEPSMSQAEEKLGSALECMNTKIEIIDVKCISGDKIMIDVDNIGDTTLVGIGLRVIGKKTSALEEIKDDVAPYGRLSKGTTNTYTKTDYGDDLNKWSVEIYPKTKTGICRDAVDTKTGIVACTT